MLHAALFSQLIADNAQVIIFKHEQDKALFTQEDMVFNQEKLARYHALKWSFQQVKYAINFKKRVRLLVEKIRQEMADDKNKREREEELSECVDSKKQK